MLAHAGGPAESPSRRRKSTRNSISLDYSTCYRVEPDIPTRIRSLLLSYSADNPPRTPWPSDEMTSLYQDDHDDVDRFDFNTARSVAEFARLQSGKWNIPSKPSPGYVPAVLAVSGQDKTSAYRTNRYLASHRALKRSVDGADGYDLDDTLDDDATIHRKLLTHHQPPSSDEGGKTPLFLQDLSSEQGMQSGHEDYLIGTTRVAGPLELKAIHTLGDSFQGVPRSERHFSLLRPSVRPVTSHSSLPVNDRPPSFGSTVSRSSAHRHALLKPSVTAWSPIDLGLPVQPILTKEAEVIPTSGSSEIYNHAASGHYHIHPSVKPVDALTSLLESPNQIGQIDSKSSNYVPNVKLGVEAATQIAVGPVVHGVILSAAGETSHVPESRLSIAPEPLAEAALRAEQYLKRNFSWADGSSTRRDQEVNFGREHTGRVSSAPEIGLLNVPINGVQDDAASFENRTPMPRSQTFAEGSSKRGLGIAPWGQSSPKSPFKRSTIPTRRSSLDRRDSVSNTALKNASYRNTHVEQVVADTSRRARSVSSANSGKVNSPYPPLSKTYEASVKLAETDMNRPETHFILETFPEPEPYTSRLTAVPPRKHRLPSIISTPVQRYTRKSDGGAKKSESKVSEKFIRTIDDLENLMSEALQMARQTAEREYGEEAVGRNGNAKPMHDTIGQRAYNKGRSHSVSHLQPPAPLKSSQTESASSTSNYSMSQNSYREDLVYEERKSRAKSESISPSVGNVVVMQRAAGTRTPYSWPLSRASTSRSVPVIAGFKSIATGILNKNNQVKVAGKGSASGNAVSASVAATDVPIKQRNTGSSQPMRNRIISEIPNSESRDDEPATVAQSQRNMPQEKKASHVRQPYEEDSPSVIKAKYPSKSVLNKREVSEFIRIFHQPPIQPRHSSLALRKSGTVLPQPDAFTSAVDPESIMAQHDASSQRSLRSFSLSTSQGSLSEVDLSSPQGFHGHAGAANTPIQNRVQEDQDTERLPKRHISGRRLEDMPKPSIHEERLHLNLRGKSHVSIHDHKGFSLSRSHLRQPIARDWSPARKRFVAAVACISTALIGILVGIYAGEVPSIQYYVADQGHFAILGNVFFFIALAITTFFFWPLPLLHGRKPYILSALTIAMPLLFPQAISVSMQRSPYVNTWRVLLILPRTLMGAALGFANMNFMATLTDLFGASLQSDNPHQETVDEFDVRRHGGGLGVWLGIWTWSYIGSIGVGFLIGAWIINTLSPDWGFYVTIVIIAAVLLLNVLTPEVRRSAYRRSVAEVRTTANVSRRVARGEVMMHRLQTGPRWWGEEFHQGVMLSLNMLRQPGFLVMALYVAWIYGQIVLIIVLLGSLMSKYYRFISPAVGATTMAIPLGALLAVPFQKASIFSRARRRPQRTDSMTFDTKITFSSHLVRRAIFTLVLPFAGLAYTLSSGGPPTPFILPVLFAGLIGFLSNLAIAECNGIIMETFDTSDLQPGMTGRPRGASAESTRHKRTNYSSFPRVSSAFAIIQALGFLLGAAATGVGGVVERHIGAQAATGVMAGILLFLTIGFLGVLYRFKVVQIIPNHNKEDMDRWERERKMSVQRQEDAIRRGADNDYVPELEEPWRPTIIGNPSGKTRRMSILELGHLSRWSEIRRKNRLVDEMSQEARHPNLVTLEDLRKEIKEKALGGLQRGSSRWSHRSRSQLSQGSAEPERDVEIELEDRSKSA